MRGVCVCVIKFQAECQVRILREAFHPQEKLVTNAVLLVLFHYCVPKPTYLLKKIRVTPGTGDFVVGFVRY